MIVRCGAAALLGHAPPRTVDEDVAHRDRGDAEEVRAVRANRRARRARELEIELVNERRRGQRVARPRGELAARGATELVVDERKDLVERFAPARAQIREQLRDARLIGVRRRHLSRRRLRFCYGRHGRNVASNPTVIPTQQGADGRCARLTIEPCLKIVCR